MCTRSGEGLVVYVVRAKFLMWGRPAFKRPRLVRVRFYVEEKEPETLSARRLTRDDELFIREMARRHGLRGARLWQGARLS